MANDTAQLDIFPADMHLRRIDTARNMRQFYKMTVQRDLFGGASLIRVWGRVGSRGRECVDRHPDEGQAINALMALARKKRLRAFRPVAAINNISWTVLARGRDVPRQSHL